MTSPITRLSNSRTRCERACAGQRCTMSSGYSTFSAAVNTGNRLNVWKMKPVVCARKSASASAERPVTSISSMMAPVLFVIFQRIRPKGIGGLEGSGPKRSAWLFGALALAINTTGTFAYTQALEGGTASLVVTISSAYPLVTVIMAVAFLREKLNRYNIAALAIVVLGLILIGSTA